MSYGLDESTISKINSVFSVYPKIKKVLIYGSRAKGNYKNGSDIDLSVVADGLSAEELTKIKIEIDDLMLPYSVDLSDYSSICSDELKEHIDRVGKPFYT